MTQRRQMMTVSEMCRLQGLPSNRIHYGKAKGSRTKLAKTIGTIMSVIALQRRAGLAARGHFDEVSSFFSHRLRSQTWDADTDSEPASGVL